MAKKMKYDFLNDPLDLIESIEQRPCLWDKTADEYKDRVKKNNAWQEVCGFIIDDYETLGDKEKFNAGKAVQEKWKHIRDAFALSLKKKSGDKRGKKYIYYDQLQFLTKILTKDDTESSLVDEEETEVDVVTEVVDFDPDSTPTPRPSKRSQRSTMNETDKAILKALKETAQPQTSTEIDEDAVFFASITPYVKKFNEEQKFDFRMRVMALIQEIKRQGVTIPPGPSSNTPSTSSWSSYETPTYHHLQLPPNRNENSYLNL